MRIGIGIEALLGCREDQEMSWLRERSKRVAWLPQKQIYPSAASALPVAPTDHLPELGVAKPGRQ